MNIWNHQFKYWTLAVLSVSLLSISSSFAMENAEQVPPPAPALVRTLNLSQWKDAAEHLTAHPELESVVVFSMKDAAGVVSWEFILERNSDGTFTEVTKHFGEEKARSLHR